MSDATVIRKRQRPLLDESPTEPEASATVERPRRAVAPPVEFKPIQVDPAKVQIVPLPPTKRYWVGAFEDAPFDVKHFGGVAFQKYTGEVKNDPKTGALILDGARHGAVIDLDDMQVDRVVQSVARSVVRTVGRREDATGNYRCDRYDVSIPGYRPSAADRPVGQYIYFCEVGQLMPPEWRSSRPPSMIAGMG